MERKEATTTQLLSNNITEGCKGSNDVMVLVLLVGRCLYHLLEVPFIRRDYYSPSTKLTTNTTTSNLTELENPDITYLPSKSAYI